MASKIVAFSPAPLPLLKNSIRSGNSNGPCSVIYPSLRNPNCLPLARVQFNGDNSSLDVRVANNQGHRRWALNASSVDLCDFNDEEKEFRARFGVPGLSKLEEVEVSVEDNTLVIKGKWKVEESVVTRTDVMERRNSTSYESSLALPDNCEKDKVKTELKNGVIYVTIPKTKVVEPDTTTRDVFTKRVSSSRMKTITKYTSFTRG